MTISYESRRKPSEFNPRTWSDHQLEKLHESIEKFGVVDRLPYY